MGGAATTGYSPTTSAIIAEELARGDFTLATAILVLSPSPTPWCAGALSPTRRWLPLWLAESPMRAAIAVQEQHLFNANQFATTAKLKGDRYELNGQKP